MRVVALIVVIIPSLQSLACWHCGGGRLIAFDQWMLVEGEQCRLNRVPRTSRSRAAPTTDSSAATPTAFRSTPSCIVVSAWEITVTRSGSTCPLSTQEVHWRWGRL
ncbi:hypothetical protein L596_007141 [Steinernema carpocapsae]|uniref:Secreted protein n=1 Tax=Steinernema carpocapsae TaxID=34508 RepID=A0A4U5P8S1_STECR|nr:hypothetical protein L596_007141 [Steinernema carpocapsae]